MQVKPYLNFGGRAEEAAAFYGKAVGAEVLMLLRFGDAPADMRMPGADLNKVMHMGLKIGDSEIFGTDGGCEASSISGFSLSLAVSDASEAERAFAALAEGGEARMPLSETFFSTRFGMLTDRFGVAWMIVAPPPASFAGLAREKAHASA